MSTDRFVAFCGAVFAVFTWVGFLILSSGQPGGDHDVNHTANFLDDQGNRVLTIVGMYLMIIGGLAFLGFTVGLAQRMAAVSTPSFAIDLARLAGSGFAIVQLVTAAGMASAAMFILSDFEELSPNADYGRLVSYAFITWQLAAMPLAAVFVGTVSYAALAHKMFPRWLGLVGTLSSFLLLLSFLFIPVVALPVWAICVSAVVLVRKTESLQMPAHTLPA